MAAFFRQHLEGVHRLPSGVFFADAQLHQERDIRPHITSPFPRFPRPGKRSGKPSFQDEQPVLCLPLLDVAVDVRVDSTIARTRLVQRFTNISTEPIPEAHYTFPLYDGAAIISFRCEIGDSKVLDGRVKPKEEAKREYRRAIEKMEAAALLEEHTPEVFETMIGNIPAKTVVKIDITYVNELKVDSGGEGILVIIPTSLAPRYGQPPWGSSTASDIIETGLSIVVGVTSSDPIKQLDCRTHPISVEMGTSGPPPEALSFDDLAKAKNKEDGLDPKKATARLSNRNASMGKDFVLMILTSGKSLLRSRALLSPPNAVGHAALMVTIKPSELFSDTPALEDFSGEIIFVADRSESMAGAKINALRDALGVFLKSLPGTCTFNLFSFGSHFSSLWQSSQPYNQENLEDAVSHVSQFQGDMGGTELFPALKHIIEHRNKGDGSTQIILITDGEVWETEETIHFVRKTRSEEGNQIRLFALGIGDEVSHRLIQGVGGEGGGYGEVVGIDTNGKWQDRIIRMLNGALMPNSWTYEIDLGPGFSSKTLDSDDFMAQGDNHQRAAAVTKYVQAPHIAPPLHHFTHKSIHFLLNLGSKPAPTTITIKATAKEGDTKTVSLPVAQRVTDTSTMQHLAAKAALLDLESLASQSQSLSASRYNAERLGEIYSISSKWTSFVAVDRTTNATNEISTYRAPVTELSLLTSPGYQDTSWATLCRPLRTLSQGSSFAEQTTYSSNNFGSVGDEFIGIGPKYLYSSNNFGSFGDGFIGLHNMSDLAVGDYRPDCDSFDSAPCQSEPAPQLDPQSQFPHFENSMLMGPVNSIPASKRLKRSQHSSPAPKRLRYLSSVSIIPRDLHEDSGIEFELGYHREVDWADIVAAQTASGIFKVSDALRQGLTKHFCSRTREIVLESIIASYATTQLTTEDNEALADTLMVIYYVKTHLNQKKYLWSLMILKAENAIKKQLLIDEVVGDTCAAILESSMIHAHFIQCLFLLQEFPLSKEWSSCRICNAKPTTAEEEGKAFPSDATKVTLSCRFDGCAASFNNWNDFWQHQVSLSHVCCERGGDTKNGVDQFPARIGAPTPAVKKEAEASTALDDNVENTLVDERLELQTGDKNKDIKPKKG